MKTNRLPVLNNIPIYPHDAMTLTQKLVSIDSTNPGNYEISIANYICDWLTYYEIPYVIEEVLDNRYNIMATLSPKVEYFDNKELVFICHMDTVIVGDGWSQNAFCPEIKNKRIYGRGSCDMKSGLACAMSILYELKQKKELLHAPFKLICTVDEEDNMRGVEKAISSNWVNKHSFILDMEPTDGQIQVAHKGRVWIRADVKGITAHASRPQMGIDAIAGIASFITHLRSAISKQPRHKELGESTITFGQIQGGYRPYVVPDHACVWMDIRTVPPLTYEKIKALLVESIIHTKSLFGNIDIQYTCMGNRPFIEKNPNSFLLYALKNACETILKISPEVSIFTGYTDSAVIAATLGNQNCMSYGPGSLNMAHKPNEYVPIEDIERCEKVLFKLAKDICHS